MTVSPRPKKARVSTRLADEEGRGIAGEAAHRAQRDVADDARHPEVRVLDERPGKRLVGAQVGADKAGEIVNVAGDLPAFDRLLDRGETPFEAILAAVVRQRDLGKDGDGPR